MYAIIEWLETKEVSVVAESWLINEHGTYYCYWPPPTMRPDQQMKALMKQLPADPNWPKFPAEVVREKCKCLSVLFQFSIPFLF